MGYYLFKAMLARQNRYTTPEFNQVFKYNRPIHGDFFIRLVPSDDKMTTKYAVVVSKKTYSRRVDRNRIRRFIYHTIKENNLTGGGIIMLRKQAVNYLNLIITRPTEATQAIISLFDSQK